MDLHVHQYSINKINIIIYAQLDADGKIDGWIDRKITSPYPLVI